MKHFYLGVAILAILLIASMAALGFLSGELQKAETSLEQAYNACRLGNYDAASASANSAHQDWERSRGLSASLVDHGPLDEVERGFARLEACGELEEWDEFAQACRELQAMLREIADREKPLYYNIL